VYRKENYLVRLVALVTMAGTVHRLLELDVATGFCRYLQSVTTSRARGAMFEDVPGLGSIRW